MERSIDNLLNEVIAQPETVGCLLTNRQGLCLGAKGSINPNFAGMGQAIAVEASKLEPNLNPPAICIYSQNKRCIIQRDGDLTAVIYKQKNLTN